MPYGGILELRTKTLSSKEQTVVSDSVLHDLRASSFSTCLCAIILAIIMLDMGYSRPHSSQLSAENSNSSESPDSTPEHYVGMSTSIVFYAFCLLLITLWVSVDTWGVFASTHQSQHPTWTWHNDAFRSTLINMLLVTLAFFPCLITYIVHMKNKEFGTSWDGFNLSTKGTFIFHLLVIITALFNFVSTISNINRIIDSPPRVSLTNSTSNDMSMEMKSINDLDEDDEKEEDEMNAFSGLSLVSDIDFDQDSLTLTTQDKTNIVIFFSQFLLQIVDQLVFAIITIKDSSGSLLLFLLELSLFAYGVFRVRPIWYAGSISEALLSRVRVWLVILFLIVWVAWWLSLGILFFLKIVDLSFFDVIFQSQENNGLPNENRPASILAILFFIMYTASSFLIFMNHTKAMASLDRLKAFQLYESFSSGGDLFEEAPTHSPEPILQSKKDN